MHRQLAFDASKLSIEIGYATREYSDANAEEEKRTRVFVKPRRDEGRLKRCAVGHLQGASVTCKPVVAIAFFRHANSLRRAMVWAPFADYLIGRPTPTEDTALVYRHRRGQHGCSGRRFFRSGCGDGR